MKLDPQKLDPQKLALGAKVTVKGFTRKGNIRCLSGMDQTCIVEFHNPHANTTGEATGQIWSKWIPQGDVELIPEPKPEPTPEKGQEKGQEKH